MIIMFFHTGQSTATDSYIQQIADYILVKIEEYIYDIEILYDALLENFLSNFYSYNYNPYLS